MRVRVSRALAAILVAGVAFGVACGEGGTSESREGAAEKGPVARAGEAVKKASRKVADEVRVLEKNVEHSAHVAEDTYKAEREEGVGRVQAAGDAYEAVLEIPEKKDSEKKESE